MNGEKLLRRCNGAVIATSFCAILIGATTAVAANKVGTGRLADDLELLAVSGNGAAAQTEQQAAWARVAAADPAELPTILSAMKDTSQVGENWIRAAADAIAERELANKRPLPAAALESFVNDLTQAPRARRVAFEWLTASDPAALDRLLPKMLADQSLELRYDAVQRVMDAAAAAKDAAEKEKLYAQAFDSARDIGQVKACAESLKALGQKPSICDQLGYILKWKVIGPFDNTGLTGFANPFPPEAGIDFTRKEKGKEGEVEWKDFESTDELGIVDLKKAISPDKEVTGYAVTTIDAPKDMVGQLRASTSNALKIWFNGQQIASYEIYHTGSDVDQFIVPVEFHKGPNQVMVKLCQNEQKQPWEQIWSFQLRATDELGTALGKTK